MKGKRDLHPEFLVGNKGSLVDTIINSLNLVCDDGVESLVDRVDKKDKKVMSRLRIETLGWDRSQEETIGKVEDDGTKIRSYDMKYKSLKNFVDSYRSNKSNPRVHVVGKSFFERVSELRRNIPFHLLGGDETTIYIKTPTVNICNRTYNGAYLYKHSIFLIIVMTPSDEYSITECNVALVMDINSTCNLGNVCLIDKIETNEAVYEGSDFTGIYTPLKIEKEQDVDKFNTYVAGIINTAVYINSKDPSIEELRPLRLYDKKQLHSVELSKRDNLCTMPVKLINWGYHDRHYHVGSTLVSGHFRWQPCGTNKADVKLIWIDEHTRTYEDAISMETV